MRRAWAICDRDDVEADEVQAIDAIRRAGLAEHGVLGAGVEGVVVDLGDGTVAKVWSSRTRADLELLREFYEGIEAGRSATATVALPYIVNLMDVDGRLITVERRLSGDPVWRADGSSPELTTGDIDAMTEALASLAAIPATPVLRSLPMLADEPPLHPSAPFEREIADLVTRRVAQFETALVAAHPDVPNTAAGTVAALQALSPATPTLVHGDLIAANVLRSAAHATAVLDFGFLSTAGDPAFDSAITASIYDMWGPRARDVERELDDALMAAFGHDHHRVLTYRAAYALITACCFGTVVSEGHFSWCINMLNRADVQEAVQS